MPDDPHPWEDSLEHPIEGDPTYGGAGSTICVALCSMVIALLIAWIF